MPLTCAGTCTDMHMFKNNNNNNKQKRKKKPHHFLLNQVHLWLDSILGDVHARFGAYGKLAGYHPQAEP